MSRFTILLGGDIQRTTGLDAQVAGTRVIAADSGMRHAAAVGLEPELWVGDFDSVDEETIAANERIPRDIHPRDKDFTDGELAVEAALTRGATEFVMVGAFGGERADHAYLHMAQALVLAEAGKPVLLTSGAQEARPLLPGRHAFGYATGTLFSILAFSELSGLTVKGAKWPLEDVVVRFGSSLTMSNAVTGHLEVSLGAGRALLIAHLDSRADA